VGWSECGKTEGRKRDCVCVHVNVDRVAPKARGVQKQKKKERSRERTHVECRECSVGLGLGCGLGLVGLVGWLVGLVVWWVPSFYFFTCLVLSCFFKVHPLGGLFLAHAEAGLHCTVQSITPPWAGCSGLVHLNQSRGVVGNGPR